MGEPQHREPKKRKAGTRRRRAGTRRERLGPPSPAETALGPAHKAPPDRKPAHPPHPSAESHQLSSEILEETGSGGVSRRAMHEAVRTADDEVRHRERARAQEASTTFRPDPETGDAAADLASELGRDMLDAATSGVDMSELVPPEESFEEEVGGPFIVSGMPVGLEDEEVEFDLRDVDEKSRRQPGK